MNTKPLSELIENLKNAVKEKDGEKAHVIYDQILVRLATQSNPDIVQLINNITHEVQFWYA